MNKLWKLFLFLLTIPSIVFSQESLVQTVDSILQTRCLNQEHTSVSIVALPSGQAVYSRHTETPLLPASVTKLVTTAAALHYLGPEYHFKTDILYTGERDGETIVGDLVIKGGGDPKLTSEQLWYIASQIKGHGIRTITGDLIIDTGFFDDNLRAPAWGNQNTATAYDANLCALSVNFNVVAVHILPGKAVNDPVIVWLEPETDYFELVNNGKTIKRGGNSVSASRSSSANGIKVKVSGSMPLGSAEKTIFLNIPDPIAYAATTFRDFLQRMGISIHGNTVVRPTPFDVTLLYRHYSAPIATILKELNTYSNNFMAEQILKTMAAEVTQLPGSHQEGQRLVRAFLKDIGINVQEVNLVDGSGLSRNNHITTAAMTNLLTTTYNRFDIGPDFIAALKVMGAEDGFSKRFSDSPARSLVRAKTGTLSGVSNLAGYVESEAGQLFAYAIFLNNNRCGDRGADQVENKIVTAIYQVGTQDDAPFVPIQQ